jgi:hypothetical protein
MLFRQSSSDSRASPPAKPAPPPKRLKVDILVDFTDSQLASLSKCVCCDIKWTTRKTRVQKIAHIGKCSRKQSLSPDVVERLVRQEFARAVAQSAGGKTKASDKPSEPTTHLEDIVDRAKAKKRGGRPAGNRPTTIQNPTDSRLGILDRARNLLDKEPIHNFDTRPAERSAQEKLNDICGRPTSQPCPSSTQSLGRSTLNQRLPIPRTHINTWGPTFDEDIDDAPPATQAFEPSRLGTNLKLGQRSIAFAAEGEDTLPATQVFASAKLGENLGRNQPSGNASVPRSPSNPPAFRSVRQSLVWSV